MKKLISFTVLIAGLSFGSALSLQVQAQATSFSDPLKHLSSYYLEANDILNQQTLALFAFFNEYSDLTQEDFVKQLTEKTGNTSNTNELSTLCTDQHLSVQCLNYKLQTLLSLKINSLPALTQENVALASQNFMIDQFAIASHLNEQAIIFYSQLLQSYPLHLQNQQILANLQAVLTDSNSLRKSFTPFANIFHDVTTAQCQ